MAKFKTSAKYVKMAKKTRRGQEQGHLYLKNVPCVYASILPDQAQNKFNSQDKAWSITVFVDEATADQIEDIGLNKELAIVGKTKKKKGQNRGDLKFPLNDVFGDYEGMSGVNFTRDTEYTVEKDGEKTTHQIPAPTVIDAEGNIFTENVGNGSVVTLKLHAYRNDEDMLVASLDTVVVLEHVEYVNDNFDEELGIAIPRQNQTSKPSAQEDEDEDEIPVAKGKSKKKEVPDELEDEEDLPDFLQ